VPAAVNNAGAAAPTIVVDAASGGRAANAANAAIAARLCTHAVTSAA